MDKQPKSAQSVQLAVDKALREAGLPDYTSVVSACHFSIEVIERLARSNNVDCDGLLPCPFCGGEAFVTYKTGDDDICRHSVHCHDRCGAQMGGTLITHYSKDSAVDAWNKRVIAGSSIDRACTEQTLLTCKAIKQNYNRAHGVQDGKS